jgi:hypothetical protein
MARNYLKVFVGDKINLLMADCAWNLKKWVNNLIYALFFSANYWLLALFANQLIERWKYSPRLAAVKILIQAEKWTN